MDRELVNDRWPTTITPCAYCGGPNAQKIPVLIGRACELPKLMMCKCCYEAAVEEQLSNTSDTVKAKRLLRFEGSFLMGCGKTFAEWDALPGSARSLICQCLINAWGRQPDSGIHAWHFDPY